MPIYITGPGWRPDSLEILPPRQLSLLTPSCSGRRKPITNKNCESRSRFWGRAQMQPARSAICNRLPRAHRSYSKFWRRIDKIQIQLRKIDHELFCPALSARLHDRGDRADI